MILSFKNITVAAELEGGKAEALRDVSFGIAAGEVLRRAPDAWLLLARAAAAP